MRHGSQVQRNFILQQGFPGPDGPSCGLQYSALLFQPRTVGLYLLVAVAFQVPLLFFVLAFILWFSAALPHLNPFDVLYNRIAARRSGISVASAPPPRRFAQCLAGTFAAAIGSLLAAGWHMSAYVLEGLLLVAVGLLALGGFCVGSFAYHVISGRGVFAARTLPWAKGE